MKVILDKYVFACKNDPKCDPRNWWEWLVGNWRYLCYYREWLRWLLRRHIREQIEWRIEVMDQECYSRGSCKMCGCSTTALQMANKACPKPCYPKMMGKAEWEDYKKEYKLNF